MQRAAAFYALLVLSAGPLALAARISQADHVGGRDTHLRWDPPDWCRGKDCPEFQVIGIKSLTLAQPVHSQPSASSAVQLTDQVG